MSGNGRGRVPLLGVECKLGANPELSPRDLNVSQLVCWIYCLLEALLVRLTCRYPREQPDSDHYRCPSISSFSEFQGGVEWTDLYSDLGSQGVACILKGSSQDVFSHSEPSLKIGVGVDS